MSSSWSDVNGWWAALPSPGLAVPLEHGEIGHPKKSKVFRGITGLGKRAMLGCVFLSKIEPELPAGLIELVHTLLRLSLAHHERPQISGLDSGSLKN